MGRKIFMNSQCNRRERSLRSANIAQLVCVPIYLITWNALVMSTLSPLRMLH